MALPNLPSSMLAWRKHAGIAELVREEVPVPKPIPNGFLVKILAAGVCHSDVALVGSLHHQPTFRDKYTLGHEGCGEIVRIGSEVKDPRFKIGDIVSLLAVPGCGEDSCTECSTGNPQLCYRSIALGIGHDGCFAPYVAVPLRSAVPLPDGVSIAEGAVATDAVLTAYHAVMAVGEVKSSDTVFIYGLGGLGFNAIQIALYTGATVIVADQRKEVLAQAVKFGIKEENVVPAGRNVVDYVTEKELVIDTVIDFVGAQETFTTAQQIVRTAGKIVMVGLLGTDLPVNTQLCVRKQLKILFNFGGVWEDVAEALQLIKKGVIKPQLEMGDLDDLPEILHRLHTGEIKSRMVLVPSITTHRHSSKL